MASFALVIAVENPMQYSVLRTSFVHCFGDRDDFEAGGIEMGGVTQSVVSPDGDQVVEV